MFSGGQRLAALGDRIRDALRTSGARKSALEALSTLPAQFVVSQAEARLDHPSLVRLRSEASDAQARLDPRSPRSIRTSRCSTQPAPI
jgi:hypothetical protein